MTERRHGRRGGRRRRGTWRCAAAAGLLALLPLRAFAQEHEGAAAPVIGAIEIDRREVFDDRSGGGFAAHRVANRVHVRTREQVVRRELLFASGDAVDRELIEQTERNLRGLSFLRDARIEAVEVDADGDGRPERVDIRVTTWDRWSLSPRVDFEQVENRTKWELGASERNLLGFGKTVTASRRVNLDRTIDRVIYQDPQLAGSRVRMRASVASLSDGHEQFVAFDRSYLSLRDRWSVTGALRRFAQTDPIYRDGVEVERLGHRGRAGELQVGRALSRGGARALRLHGGYRVSAEEVGPERRNFGVAEIGLRSVSHRFVRLTHVNQFERTEDFNLGAESYATVGLSAAALGGASGGALFAAAGHRQGVRFRDDHFAVLGVAVGGRRERDVWRNALVVANARYLRKQSARTALIGKLDYRHGHRLDPEIQLRLGADSGLRGYPNRQFNGTRALLLTAEERWFLADDLWQLLSVGVAAFVDSGYAWPADRPVDLSDLKTSVGVSLLLGSHRLASRGGVRFDLGYGLDPVVGARRWIGRALSDIAF